MKTKKILKEKYNYFSMAEGNQHIASEYAIKKLQKLIEIFSIGNVLEVGLGIGSISGSLLKVNKHLNYTGTENNFFCLEALRKNLGANYQKMNIYSELNQIPDTTKFDLIIIDGKDQNLEKIKNLLSSKGIISIEGDRLPQQKILKELFPAHKYVHSISTKKNSIMSPFANSHWQGGIKIILSNPSSKQKMWWLKERLLTKLKYFYRDY